MQIASIMKLVSGLYSMYSFCLKSAWTDCVCLSMSTVSYSYLTPTWLNAWMNSFQVLWRQRKDRILKKKKKKKKTVTVSVSVPPLQPHSLFPGLLFPFTLQMPSTVPSLPYQPTFPAHLSPLLSSVQPAHFNQPLKWSSSISHRSYPTWSCQVFLISYSSVINVGNPLKYFWIAQFLIGHNSAEIIVNKSLINSG